MVEALKASNYNKNDIAESDGDESDTDSVALEEKKRGIIS